MEKWEQEIADAKFVNNVFYEKLRFCGCGCPEDTLLFIKKLLNIINKRTEENMEYNEYQDLLHKTFEFEDQSKPKRKFTDIQEGIIQFILYHLDEVEILEHGGEIGGAWLTKTGKRFLEILNNYEDNELENLLVDY